MHQPPHPTSDELDPSPSSVLSIRDRIFRILTLVGATVGWVCILAFAVKPFLTVKATAEGKLVEPAPSAKINPVQVKNTQRLISSQISTQNNPPLPNVQQQQPISPPASVVQSSTYQNLALKTAVNNSQSRIKKFGWKKSVNTLASANRSQPLNSPAKISTQFQQHSLSASSSNSPTNNNLESKKRGDLQTETKQKPAQQPSVTDEPGILLTVSDIVILALQNNRGIKNAYLERIVQRQDLAVAQDKFVPNFTPRISIALDRQRVGAGTSKSGGVDLGANVSVTLPAGGNLSFGWNGTGRALTTNNFDFDDDFNDGGALGQNLQLNFNQPLLRGFGVEVNRASIDIARLNEQANILFLKSTLSDIITNAILAYRNLLQAQERVKIERISLEIAQQQLETLQVLINAGREAPVDIFPSETNVASRQLTLLAAENERERVRLELIKILDIERTTNILAAAPSSLPTTPPDVKNLNQLALTNNPNYLRSTLALDISKFALLLAENERKWNLDFNATYGNVANTGSDKTTDVRAGLTFSREFGDLTVEQRYQRSRVNRLQAENSLNDVKESLEIEVTDRIRDVNLKLKQVELAQRARELSEKQLSIEQEKLKLGISNIIDVVGFQNDLAQARNAELDARIDYLNALTLLEQTVGITLDAWNITVETK
ncbi:TolC family protein [Microcoleus sp. FACHB-672]|uniref:TolC family protein n=1 Tax=Microcoleus sp. FACHB-672 TaxID=2692825 RepID=UPI0016841305|nr:TolC family protein [Microcoleus sp. FACHB-672]MBD2042493.1 TolC family protein [Microcoleus sp. FACHB-672]